MTNFMNEIKNELNNAKSVTENGAIGYKTTGKELLDMNFAISSMRSWDEAAIEDKFQRVFFEDPVHAMEFLFFVRDARGGMGERRTFRICMKWLIMNEVEYALAVLDQIVEYGRWDDVIDCFGYNDVFDATIIVLLKTQLAKDMKNIASNAPISLLAKWMPSENATSKETVALARKLIKNLGITAKEYRKMLSQMRKYLDVVEVKTCKNEWNLIDYNTVPSCANLKYGSAFMRHDAERRSQFFEKLNRGEAKINAKVLFPCDIINQYTRGRRCVYDIDFNLEALWNALPDYVKGQGNTICVADGSGSMMSSIGDNGSSLTCLDVANALAIYFAEHSTGAYKNKYITFSDTPQFVDFSNAKTLKDKLKIAFTHCEVADTNIEAVFDLILDVAIKNNVPQSEIPNILILSDMEFNGCARTNNYGSVSTTLFDHIAQKYAAYGYKLPKLTFWNINSRTNTIPVRNNECGVALVSGFSPAIMDMVLSAELDPYKILINKLESERYAPIGNAVKTLCSN